MTNQRHVATWSADAEESWDTTPIVDLKMPDLRQRSFLSVESGTAHTSRLTKESALMVNTITSLLI